MTLFVWFWFSALDAESERVVQDALDHVVQGRLTHLVELVISVQLFPAYF